MQQGEDQRWIVLQLADCQVWQKESEAEFGAAGQPPVLPVANLIVFKAVVVRGFR